MNLKLRGILFTILGLAGLAGALRNTPFRFFGVVIALVFFFLAASVFSNAGRLATSLVPFVKKSVGVEVWGTPLPVSSRAILEIDSVSAVGAGLLIHVRETPGGPRVLLKIAQPGSARLQEGRVEIGEAAYVSWAGKKLKPADGKGLQAVALVIRSDPSPGG